MLVRSDQRRGAPSIMVWLRNGSKLILARTPTLCEGSGDLEVASAWRDSHRRVGGEPNVDDVVAHGARGVAVVAPITPRSIEDPK